MHIPVYFCKKKIMKMKRGLIHYFKKCSSRNSFIKLFYV